MVLGGLGGVMGRMSLVTLRHMSMMRRRFVIAFLMMSGSFTMMIGRVVMVLGRLNVVMRRFLRHVIFLSVERFRTANLEYLSHCRQD